MSWLAPRASMWKAVKLRDKTLRGAEGSRTPLQLELFSRGPQSRVGSKSELDQEPHEDAKPTRTMMLIKTLRESAVLDRMGSLMEQHGDVTVTGAADGDRMWVRVVPSAVSAGVIPENYLWTFDLVKGTSVCNYTPRRGFGTLL